MNKTTLTPHSTIPMELGWPLAVALLLLHVLIVGKFYVLFADYGDESWRVFMRNFHMSGFDPITYDVVTAWHQGYDVVRHPLLAFLMYPLYLLNQALWQLTGVNCVQFVVGALLLACGLGSAGLLHRLLRSAVGIGGGAAWLLCYLFFGFAYVVVACIVPDHFCLSLFLLLLTLALLCGGQAAVAERRLPLLVPLLIVVVGGVTLSNAVVVAMATWARIGRRFFRPRFLLGSVVLPCVALLVVAVGLKLATDAAEPSALSPIEEQFAWVRGQVSRLDVVVENFLGESLQLHRRHVLGDVLRDRPVIVRYTWPWQYVAEGVLAMLFLWGCWAGRRERFGRLLMGILAYNVLLHVVLGFALDEVHIMAAHWAFVIPLSIGWLLRGRARLAVVLVVAVLTVYLWVYHGVLLWRYLTWPLQR